MTEIWAGICRLIRIQAYDVQIWLLERKKWLLDCGVLVTADGAEVELYGNGGNA